MLVSRKARSHPLHSNFAVSNTHHISTNQLSDEPRPVLTKRPTMRANVAIQLQFSALCFSRQRRGHPPTSSSTDGTCTTNRERPVCRTPLPLQSTRRRRYYVVRLEANGCQCHTRQTPVQTKHHHKHHASGHSLPSPRKERRILRWTKSASRLNGCFGDCYYREDHYRVLHACTLEAHTSFLYFPTSTPVGAVAADDENVTFRAAGRVAIQ